MTTTILNRENLEQISVRSVLDDRDKPLNSGILPVIPAGVTAGGLLSRLDPRPLLNRGPRRR